jgi:hypothetical protein
MRRGPFFVRSFTGSQGLCFFEFFSFKLFIVNMLVSLTVSQPENGGWLFCESIFTK